MRQSYTIPFNKHLARVGVLERTVAPRVREGAVVLLDQGFYSFANFLTGVLVARSCAREQYGFYILALTLLNVAAAVLSSLATAPFTVTWPGLNQVARKTYLGTSILLSAGITIVLVGVFAMTALVLSMSGMLRGLGTVMLAMSTAMGFVLLRNLVRSVYLAQLRVWRAFLVGSITNMAAVALLSWSYSSRVLTPSVAYLIMAASASGAGLVAIGLEARAGGLKFSLSKTLVRTYWQENWRIGKWLLAGTGLYIMSAHMYPWALAAMKGPELAAVFGACLLPVAVVSPALQGLSRYLEPQAARAAVMGPAHVRRLTHLMMLFVAIAFATLLVLFLLSGGYIMHRLFGGKYDGLNLLLVLIIVEEGFGAVGMPLNCGLLAIKRTAVGFQSQLISAVVAVVLGLPLTYLIGPLGTAFSLCVSKGLSTFFAWVKFDAATLHLSSGRLASMDAPEIARISAGSAIDPAPSESDFKVKQEVLQSPRIA